MGGRGFPDGGGEARKARSCADVRQRSASMEGSGLHVALQYVCPARPINTQTGGPRHETIDKLLHETKFFIPSLDRHPPTSPQVKNRKVTQSVSPDAHKSAAHEETQSRFFHFPNPGTGEGL